MFNAIIYQPLYNLLVGLISLLPGLDLGIYIVLFTLIVKLVLLPLSLKAIRAQKALKEVEPEVKKVQAKYKDDRHAQAAKLMELYRERKVRPFASFGLILVQIPIILGLYYIVYRSGLPEIEVERLYAFIPLPGHNPSPFLLGLVDVTARSLSLALLAGLTQYWQTKLAMPTNPTPNPDDNPQAAMVASITGQMRYIFPVMITVIAYSLSAAVAIYFITSNLFHVVQEIYVRREKNIDDQSAIAYDI